METRNHEYYVSLEVAKLLKEAGFDWEICDGYIIYEDDSGFTTELQTPHNFNGDNGDLFIDYRGHKEVLSRPTLSAAQRWLREVKGICLTVQPLFDKVNEQFNVVVGFTPFLHRMDGEMIIISLDSEYTYEKALEAGIKKALELILEGGE